MRIHRLAVLLLAVLLPLTLGACVPANGNTSVSRYSVGTAGVVSYGTIMAMTPVQITGTRTGLGAGVGGIGGSLIGSTIGGGWQAQTIAAVAGGLIGALAGAAVEEGVTSGQGMRFIVRLDNGMDIEVVQTNELGLMLGERVAVSQGDRVRLARLGPPPMPAMPAPRAAN